MTLGVSEATIAYAYEHPPEAGAPTAWATDRHKQHPET